MPGPSLNILIVEDNEGDVRLVREYLASLMGPPFTVSHAETLSEAIEFLPRQQPDVVLLDLGLPDSQGLETLQRLCEHADIPIVVITGHHDEELGSRSLDLGAQDYLIKGEFQSGLLRRSLRYAIQRKNAERQLQQGRDEALAYSRLKSAFLTKVSHELRTPLTGVLGMLTLLEQTELSAEQTEYTGSMRTSSELLLRNVNDLLDLSRLEAGAFILKSEPVDVLGCLEEAAEVIAASAYLKGLEVALYIDPRLPTELVGDAGRLRQILVNLLSNAIKFTERGELLMLALLEEASDTACVVRFEVHDKGPGIPAEYRSQLFQSFAQVPGTEHSGSGLGLCICRQLLELMGGEIGFADRPEGGTTFWFSLPVARAAGAPAANSSRWELRGRRVGLQVANREVRQMLQRQLEAWEIEVTSVPQAEVDVWIVQAEQLSETFAGSAPRILLHPIHLPVEASIPPTEGRSETLTRPVFPRRLYHCLSSILGLDPGLQTVVEKEEKDTTRTRPGRLLVAEDNPISLRFLTLTLEKMGHDVVAVDNGVAALEAVSRESFDLVFMDCNLPQMDGMTASREIRRLEGSTGQIPIVALTAHAMAEDRDKCLDAGMSDYMSKPVSMETLSQLLRKWLGKAA